MASASSVLEQHAPTLDDVISQLQALTTSVTDLTQQMASTNSRFDFLVGQVQQLSHYVSPFWALISPLL